jgi:hypothetical protein
MVDVRDFEDSVAKTTLSSFSLVASIAVEGKAEKGSVILFNVPKNVVAIFFASSTPLSPAIWSSAIWSSVVVIQTFCSFVTV